MRAPRIRRASAVAAWRARSVSHDERARSRASVEARERARSSWDTLRARQAATAEARRIRGALMLLESDRRQALQELGAAAHAGDSTAEEAGRARLTELDTLEARLRAELDEAL